MEYVLDAIMLENLSLDHTRVSDVTTNLPDMLQAKSERYFQGQGNGSLESKFSIHRCAN